MVPALFIGLGAAGGWLLKDLGGRVVARMVARSGRIGYAPRECGFYCESTTEDGQRVAGRYYPDNIIGNERVHYLRLAGDLYNDSYVAILLKNPSVTFWSKDGPELRHANPDICVAGEKSAIVSVPPHGRTTIALSLALCREDLDQKYASTIPVLNFEEVNGRKREFRAAQTSFHGSLAAWPRKGKLPILLLGGSAAEAETDEPSRLGEGKPTQTGAEDQHRDRAV